MTKIEQAARDRGIFVVLVGPDGCGKSSTTAQLAVLAEKTFTGYHQFHWRPGLLPKLGRSNNATSTGDTSPPSVAKQNRLISTVRFIYYSMDFILGHWTHIRPKVRAGMLVVCERHFTDTIVNPARYGFALPRWLIRMMGYLIPKPDLTLLLYDDAEKIHQRKAELEIPEIARQIVALQKEIRRTPLYTEVKTDGGIKHTAQEVMEQILLVGGRSSATTHASTGTPIHERWRQFPRGGTARITFPKTSAIVGALELYQPQSLAGRSIKWVANHMPNFVSARLFCSPLRSLRMQKWVWDHTAPIMDKFQDTAVNIALNIGTPGPHQKHTLRIASGKNVLAYAKTALSDAAKTSLQRESRALQTLESLQFSHAEVPKLISELQADSEEWLYESSPTTAQRARGKHPVKADVGFITELFSRNIQKIQLQELDVKLNISQRLKLLKDTMDPHRVKSIARAWQQILSTNGNRSIQLGYSHGDYAPWNTFALSEERLYVYDWEYFSTNTPALYDAFYFLFITRFLVDGITPDLIASMLHYPYNGEKDMLHDLCQKLDIDTHDLGLYCALFYLLHWIRRAETLAIDGCGQNTQQDSLLAALDEGLLNVCSNSGEIQRRRVLISAYACEPDQGSEPGVGWCWVDQIARTNEVWVITRKNNRTSIEAHLNTHPNVHIHPVYTDLPPALAFWKRKQRGVRTYYYLWQFAAFVSARRLLRVIDFDVGHHVTFVNDWLWTCFALLPIPYVWGPIGSHPRAPKQLLPNSRARFMENLRVGIQSTMRCIDPLYWLSALRADRIVAINRESAAHFPLHLLGKNKTLVRPAIGVEELPAPVRESGTTRCTFIFVGRFVPLKAPAIALEAFANLSQHTQQDIRLLMIGKGQEKNRLQQLAAQWDIVNKIEFIDWLPREEMLSTMGAADVFLFPSLEGGGMVVLEAMMLSLPVICLDFGGPGEMVDANSGYRVAPGKHLQVVEDLEQCMSLMLDPATRLDKGTAARERAKNVYTWEQGNAFVDSIYDEICGIDSLPPH